MSPKEKAKGRANSALRIGLREARDSFLRLGLRDEAEAVTRSLRRSERLERHG